MKRTNGELDIMFQNLKEDSDEKHAEFKEMLLNQNRKLDKIETQTTLTNGRVNRLEWWRNAVIWLLGALWVALVIIIPVLFKISRNAIEKTVNDTIDSKWQSLLSEYDQIIIKK